MRLKHIKVLCHSAFVSISLSMPSWAIYVCGHVFLISQIWYTIHRRGAWSSGKTLTSVKPSA
jgi:hypothetical protein